MIKKVIFSAIVFCFVATGVFAQSVDLSVTPPHLESIMKPGKSVLIAYTVRNFGDPMVMKIHILPFAPLGDQGQMKIGEQFEGAVRFSTDNADYQLDAPFFLNSRSSKQILLRIRIPEGAPNGDYYYAFIAETTPSPVSEGASQPQTQARIASPILISVTGSGELEAKGKVSLFDVLPRFRIGNLAIFDSGDKIPVVLNIENSGHNFIKPQGTITLKEMFGSQANYDIIPQNVLAQSQRMMIASDSAQVSCENNNAIYCRRPITLLLSGFFLGHYTLSAEINFGETTSHVFGSTSFIAVPIKFVIGLLIALIIGLVLVRRFAKPVV